MTATTPEQNPAGRLRLADKLRQRWLWPSIRSVAVGVPLQAPVVVELDPTSFCNLACPECISQPTLNAGRFKSERLHSLCEELTWAGVRAVIIIGGGEPLLHPATTTAIRTLASGGVAVAVTTNGTLLDRHCDVLARYAAWTRISVDAATAQTYEKIRPARGGRNLFNKVVQNIERLAALERRGAVGFSFLLLHRADLAHRVTVTNYHELLPAAVLARNLGCDYFEVKPSFASDHRVLAVPGSLRAALENDIQALAALETPTFRILAPSTLGPWLEAQDDAERLSQPKPYSWCPISELRTVVTSSGCFVCPYHRGSAERCYGDPLTLDFRQLWLSERRIAVMRSTDPSRDCAFHCIRHESNMSILDAGRRNDDHTAGLVDDFDPFI